MYLARKLAAVAFECVGPPLNSQFVKKVLSGDMYEKLVKGRIKAWRKKMFSRAGLTRLPLFKNYERFVLWLCRRALEKFEFQMISK